MRQVSGRRAADSPCAALARFSPLPTFASLARRARKPRRAWVFEWRNRRFDFCRFCHFRVLTAKRVSHITRLADADGLAARRQRFLIGQICCRATGSKILFPKIRKPASTDAALERGSQGPLFDIVKMEERETWTARFLRSDREIGRNRLRRYVFSRGTLPITRGFGPRSDRMCVLVNLHRKMQAQNVQTSTKSDIKLESLILAQNERWRQA